MTETRLPSVHLRERRLPTGYTARPPTLDDIPAAVDLFNAVDRVIIGVESYAIGDLTTEWNEPDFNLETDSLLVFAPHGRLVGYQEVHDHAPHVSLHTFNQVHPDYVGQGIGAYLMQWAEARARRSIEKAPADARVIMTGFVPTISKRAIALFQQQGFDLVRYGLRMVIDLPEPPPAPVWPEGITVRTMDVETEVEAVAMAVRESFRDHYGFVERPWEDDVAIFRNHMEYPGYFDPELYFVAWDGDQIAGISLCLPKWFDDPDMGWVSTLGVLRPWRRRGLGLALLLHSFGAHYRRGKRKVGLGVDASSLTGATRLYEKAGMRSDEDRKFARFEKELRPGVDLSTKTA